MALVLADRVKETTTTTGTGTLTLAGAATGFQSFSVIGNANTTYYAISSSGSSEWEVGLGTYTSSGTTLARTTILASSNAGSAVNLSAGTKDVFVIYPAGKAVLTDATQTLTNKTLTSPTLTTPALGTPASGVMTNVTGLPLSTGVTGTLPVANGGTGVTTSTGSGNVVLSTSPTLVTPVLGTPTSGNLTNCTADGTNSVGYLNIPQNSQSAAYTCVLADAGKHIFHPSSDANARTFTIPANSSVAYPIGTAITFVNMTSQVVTIAITTDTMYLSSAGTTGSRSLAQYGSATALKITSTSWIISGSGLT